MVVYCQGFINYFQVTELNLCCRGYIVLLQQDLKGEVLFVEAAPLDRHNCEEKQINLPRPTNLILCFFPSVSSSECFWNQNHSSFLWFPLFNFTSLSLFSFIFTPALMPKCLFLSYPARLLINSLGFRLSYPTTNKQSGCAHSQRIRNTHGNPFTLYHNISLISL